MTACTRPPLQVEIKYISRENLASYYVNTPDPHLLYPKVGQDLAIQWNIPEEEFSPDLYLVISLNMRDYTERECCYRLNRPTGYKVISVANDDYFSSGGILSFRVEIQRDGIAVYCRKHQLHVDLIHIEEGECPELSPGLAPEEPIKVGPFVDEYILPDFGGHGKPESPPTSF